MENLSRGTNSRLPFAVKVVRLILSWPVFFVVVVVVFHYSFFFLGTSRSEILLNVDCWPVRHLTSL